MLAQGFKQWISTNNDLTQKIPRHIGTLGYFMLLLFQGFSELVQSGAARLELTRSKIQETVQRHLHYTKKL